MESARSIAAGATNCSIELSIGGAVLAFWGRLLPASAPADSASSSETLSARLLIFSSPTPADDRRIRLIAASMTCRTTTMLNDSRSRKFQQERRGIILIGTTLRFCSCSAGDSDEFRDFAPQ